MVLTGN